MLDHDKTVELNRITRKMHSTTNSLAQKLFMLHSHPTEIAYEDALDLLRKINYVEKECQLLLTKLT